MNQEWINALGGGLLIGVAVSLMLLWNGRVTGISGIVYGILNPKSEDVYWRLSFIGGLVCGGLALNFAQPDILTYNTNTTAGIIMIAGFLVGFGTVLGNGCTSGHGVCGISRLSTRSIVATLLFVTTGMLTVFICRKLGIS